MFHGRFNLRSSQSLSLVWFFSLFRRQKERIYAFSVIVPSSVILTAGWKTLSPETAFGIFNFGVISIDGFNHFGFDNLY